MSQIHRMDTQAILSKLRTY